jgi:uncharacterized membrane protein
MTNLNRQGWVDLTRNEAIIIGACLATAGGVAIGFGRLILAIIRAVVLVQTGAM